MVKKEQNTQIRKIISIVLVAVFVFTVASIPASAEQLSEIQTIEYEDDGSYFVTEINTEGYSLLSTTVTKSKTGTFYSSSGDALWSVTVKGTFTYGNGTSKCTSASASAKSYSSSWKVSNKSSSYSGNKATATATGIQYSGNKEVDRITKTVTLTCSSTGKFS